jgi:hypothetical protein
VYKILVIKPEGKIPPTRPKCRCEDNIKMDPRERGWEVVDWINLTHNARFGVSTAVKMKFVVF